ncbi:LOW QUALITY PROTEIN: E3 ubiquitin-protein ligase RNF212B [Ciconia boyciana]|uniref:LOW QUALITY PROTEIN: E3 ubiquitin-protein ligase RNF212B n=1 Tax=Ciconia boyciana TaxID=52775 RepID=UPI003BA3A9BC
MDWFHCNRCFRQEGARFAVTSCGHVLCAACGGAGPCPVCAADCRYLPISDEASRRPALAAMLNLLPPPPPSAAVSFPPRRRPQEKLFFKSPADIALKRLTHVSQVWRFQRAQSDLLLASHKEAARRARAALEDARHVLDARNKELEALRRENADLRRAQLSPGWRGGSRSSTPRPVGVTSPAQTVTPQPRRQLSGQVPLHPAGAPCPAAPGPAGPPPAPRTPLWVPWATPLLPAAIFPGETPPSYPAAGLRPPPRG